MSWKTHSEERKNRAPRSPIPTLTKVMPFGVTRVETRRRVIANEIQIRPAAPPVTVMHAVTKGRPHVDRTYYFMLVPILVLFSLFITLPAFARVSSTASRTTSATATGISSV